MSHSQIPSLSPNMLYIISEKLIYKKPPNQWLSEMELTKPNGYTLFMYHSEDKMRAFLSHFSNMKRLDLSTSRTNTTGITFYKNVDSSLSNFAKCDFAGPYKVTKRFVLDLIDLGFLQIALLQSSGCLKGISDFKNLTTLTISRMVCHLLRLKEHRSMKSEEPTLLLKKFDIYETTPNIKKHLLALLSLNANEVEIRNPEWENSIIFDCSAYIGQVVCANNTHKIQIKSSVDLTESNEVVQKINSDLKSFVKVLLNFCPNLNCLQFEFFPTNVEFSKENLASLQTFVDDVLEQMKGINIGNKQLQMQVQFCVNCLEHDFQAISQDHKLLTMGVSFVIEEESDPYIARKFEAVDELCRKHVFILKIFTERPNLSDHSFYEDMDDRNEYYYYPDYYDTDGDEDCDDYDYEQDYDE